MRLLGRDHGFRKRLEQAASGRVLWAVLAMALALAAFLSTVQLQVNGAQHPYTTDVGEIQNALPRWGLIHRSGYPLYTALGSLFVTLLRAVGLEPAAGTSLYSTVWAVAAAGLLVLAGMELGASGPAALLGALWAALSTSMWVNASIAEVHSLTMAFTAATLLLGARFGRTGDRRDLFLLTLAFTQGVVHQRSVVLIAPTVILLGWAHRRLFWQNLAPVIGLALLAPLTYLYLPLRVWTGATWVFGSPGTWPGFLQMLFDNRAERVVALTPGWQGWAQRLSGSLNALGDDMPWPLLVLGLVGLLLPASKRQYRTAAALALCWVLNLGLTLLIWVGYVGDAQLAAKLPVIALAGMGLGLALTAVRARWRRWGAASGIVLALVLVGWSLRVRPFVLSLTRDRSAETVIALAAQVAPPPDERPITLAIPWGHNYWALTYAQAYRDELEGVGLVDHNADLKAIVDRGDRLMTLSDAFYSLPVEWWEHRLGRVHMAMAAPGLVELGVAPPALADHVPGNASFDLENGLVIRDAELERHGQRELMVTVYWEAREPVSYDYSVAVHLVAHDPPRGGSDLISQADTHHPVAGWYPTTRWSAGEVVRDCYLVTVPPDTAPVAVRIGLYRLDESGSVVNSPWLSLPVTQAWAGD